MDSPHQKVAKAKGLIGRSFSVDGKDLFKALSSAAFNLVQTKWEDAAGDAVDAISAVGLGTEPPALAFTLIRRASMAAMFTIIGEAKKSNLLAGAAYTSATEKAVESLISEHEIFINDAFFERPGEMPVVKDIQTLLCTWLNLIGIETHIAKTIAERFSSYFLFSLTDEWRKNADLYQPVFDSIKTPFTQASERAWAWRSYAALLQRRIDESLYDEAFSLKQVYVPLRAYYKDATYRKDSDSGLEKRTRERVVVDIKTELLSWLTTGDPNDAIRVVSGGPGSGKSSFAKIFAAEAANVHDLKVLFIPLHLIDPSRDITAEVGRFVVAESILPYNPVELGNAEGKLLIIFDGLDELANQGKAANETARLFAVEVGKMVNLRNSNSLRLQVIISGRELIVQGNESEFRKPHQILTLLPYLIEDNAINDVRDVNKLAMVDQRTTWWIQYGKLTGKDYEDLPAPLKIRDLEEITSQPLLNYLVALSYTREKLDFTKNINLNQVYADLVSAVYERAYEKKRPHESIRNMKPDDFLRILEEIGLAAWHGDGRTTTVQEITRHCQESGLGKLLSDFKEGAEAGVIRLLAAFFFRQHDQNAKGDQTFEFTHKSFGEYLAAQRIVREMDKIMYEREARAKNTDRGCSERDALVYWLKTTSANSTTHYLTQFIGSELSIRGERFARKVQACFVDLFSFMLANGMPVEALGASTFKEMCFLSRNSEEALLVSMSLCARVTRKVSQIRHPDAYAFGAWFRRIQGQRKDGESVLGAHHLDWLMMKNLVLDMSDLYGSNMSNSLLNKTHLHFATVARSSFMNTDMRGVVAAFANFDGSVIRDANLSGAQFSQARFERTILNNVKLDKSRFSDVHVFVKSKIENCDFDTAIFIDAYE